MEVKLHWHIYKTNISFNMSLTETWIEIYIFATHCITLKIKIMKKLFAIIALVAFFGAIASPAIAATYSAPIAVKVIDDKPKKAKTAAETDKKADCSSAEKKACCESKKECSGTEKK